MSKFVSRKFLLIVATVATLLANDQWTEAVAAVLGYCGINGVVAIKAGSGEALPLIEDAQDDGEA